MPTIQQVKRTKEQQGQLVYEIIKAIADQKLTSTELSYLQPVLYSGDLDLSKLVGKGKVLPKLFGVAEALDAKFPLFEQVEDEEEEEADSGDANLAATVQPAAPAKTPAKPKANKDTGKGNGVAAKPNSAAANEKTGKGSNDKSGKDSDKKPDKTSAKKSDKDKTPDTSGKETPSA